MLLTLSWLFVLVLLAGWSLAAWATRSLAVWTLSGAGTLSAGTFAERMPWLSTWMPADLAIALHRTMVSLGPWLDSLQQATPGLAGGITVAAWVVWGLGAVLLLLIGAGLHWLIRRGQRSGDRPGGGMPPTPAAPGRLR